MTCGYQFGFDNSIRDAKETQKQFVNFKQDVKKDFKKIDKSYKQICQFPQLMNFLINFLELKIYLQLQLAVKTFRTSP